jgi:hypothetical protein
MTRVFFAFLMVLSLGLAVSGCRAEGEIDTASSVSAPR